MADYVVPAVTRRQALQSFGGLLLAGMAGGGLAGCGGSSDSGATSVSAWINRPENRAAITAIIDEFEKTHTDIDVDMDFKPAAQYPTLLKTALVGGSAPDAIATNGASGIWGDLGADNDYIRPLDGRIPLDELQPSVANAVQYKGHTYGAPVQVFRIGVYYHKAIFAEHGLQPPKSWDELMEVSKTLKSKGVTPWAMPGQDMIIPFFFYHLAVSTILGENGYADLRAGRRKLTDPDLLPAAKLLADMQPYFNPGYQAVAYTEGKALFAQGKTAMTVGGSTDYDGYTQINPKLDAGFFGFPSQDGSQVTALSGLSMAYVVNKKAKEPEAAVTFASWLTSETAQRLVLQRLGLPSRAGIQPEDDSTRSTVMRAILEVPASPSWLDFPETGGTADAATRKGSGLFTGKLAPEQFAELLQSTIKPKSKD